MSIKKNFLYNVLYQILIIILPLITTPYIARVIGANGVGIYSYSYSVANYFVIIAMLGIGNYGNRSIASVRDNKNELNKTFSSILMFHIITSSVMILIYSIYVIFFVSVNRSIFIIQSLFVISSLFDISWFFFGIEQFKLTVIRNTLIKIGSVFLIFTFVNGKEDLWIYVLILAGGTLLSQVLLWPFLKKYVKFKKPTIKEIFIHLKPCSVLFIPVVAISIYKIMDKIMLGSMTSMTQVGFFENSEKIINIPISIISALGVVMLPKMSNLNSKGLKEESRKYIFISIQFAMFIACGSIFGLIGVAPILIPMFLGNEFTECINIVSLLSITILFISWANVIRTQYIIPNKLDKIQVISTIIGAVVNLLINLLLIKRMGAIGASIGTIFAEFAVAAYVTIKVKKHLPVKEYVKSTVIFVFSAVIMLIVINLIGNVKNISKIILVVIQSVVGSIVYLSITCIYLIKSKSEIGLYIINSINNIYVKILKNINK